MRIAIAGLGGAARRGHLPALRAIDPDAILAAAADPDARRREELTATRPDVPTFASAADMLSVITCDLLIVATEPDSHAALIAVGMDHGLHVVCEKPLTVTRADHAAVVTACARRPDLALIAVHQYRYSPQWTSMARWARAAASVQRPFDLTVGVQRNGTDSHAASPWRSNDAQTGGMLADIGAHFLALAWTIHTRLDLLAAASSVDERGRERATSIHRVGSGVLRIELWNGAPARHTRIDLRLGRLAIAWHDDAANMSVGSRSFKRRRVGALSDRRYVDALYAPLYRDVLAGVRREQWRTCRTAEALAVSEALVSTLEHATPRG